MVTVTLEQLLSAKRSDLVDGFPARAVIASMQADNSLVKLNELLALKNISVRQIVGLPNDLTVVNPYMLKLGVISGSCSNTGTIEIVINELFFDKEVSTVIIKALTFQSVCVHQLLHRVQDDHRECMVFYRPLDVSMNDDRELEAMGAGLAHDIKCKSLVSMTGEEQLQQLSPRLANIMANSVVFQPGSITKLQEHVKKFS